MPKGKAPAPARPASPAPSPVRAVPARTQPVPELILPRGTSASGTASAKPAAGAEAAPSERASLGPPPALTQPKSRLQVQQAAQLSQELEALKQGAPANPSQLSPVQVSAAPLLISANPKQGYLPAHRTASTFSHLGFPYRDGQLSLPIFLGRSHAIQACT